MKVWNKNGPKDAVYNLIGTYQLLSICWALNIPWRTVKTAALCLGLKCTKQKYKEHGDMLAHHEYERVEAYGLIGKYQGRQS